MSAPNTHSPSWSCPPPGLQSAETAPPPTLTQPGSFSPLSPRGERGVSATRALSDNSPIVGGTPEQGENRDKQNPADKWTLSLCSPAPCIKD